MRLRVFGRTSDEKGTQLEELTRRVLERLGYTQVSLNIVGSGGSEIDVHAEFSIPSPLGAASVRVLGECKAYETPINLPDWLKFLGKIYSEEAKLRNEVRGLFVALSGANGNVRGAVDELRSQKKNIDFVDGENLIALVRREFNVPTLEEVARRVVQLTSDPVAEFSLGYFERQAFWTLQFADGAFTILLGKSLAETASPSLVRLVSTQLQASKYRNLYQEEEHRRRLKDTRKLVLSRLLAERDTLSHAAFLVQEGDFVPAVSDVDEALAALVGLGLVTSVSGGYALNTAEDQRPVRVSILLELTDERMFLSGVCSPGWLSLIDSALLDAIAEIQGNLPLPDSLRSEAICLLRWSPTALAWSLRPDPMILTHRRTPEECAASNSNDLRYFRVQLLRYAVSDFMLGPFATTHFEKMDLREVEFLRRARFKSSTKLELEVEVSERFATARTTTELGGGIVRIWVHEDAPEPWNWVKSDGQVVDSETADADRD